MSTTTQICQRLAQKLGTLEAGTTTVLPSTTTDTDAIRVIVAAALYDSDGETDKFDNCFAYLPQSGEIARCRSNGFVSSDVSLFTPPGSSTYTLTMHGYGTTAAIAFNAAASAIQTAIRLITGLSAATVTGPVSGVYTITPHASDPIDITPSAGTISTRGLGRVRVAHPFASILAAGTSYVINGFIPWLDNDGWKGLRTFANEALAQTPFVYRIPLTQTVTNRSVFDLSAERDWLKLRKQVIGLYGPGTFSWTGSFTPPGSATYTLSLQLGATSYTTASLAFGATAATVQAALQSAIAATGVVATVSGTSPQTVTIATSKLYPILLSATGATVGSQATTEEIEPDFLGPGGLFAYRNGFPVFEANASLSLKETRFLACYRRASTWIAPQTAWNTPAADAAFASSTTGLVGPSDRAQVDTEQVATLAYAMACEYLYDRTKDAEWQKKLQRVGQQALYAAIFDTQEERNPGRIRNGFGSGGFFKLPGGGLGYS